MENWSRGFMDEYFQVSLRIFARFLERKSCATCQLVVHHFETSKMGHPFRPSCRLIFSKNAGNNFWIKPVCSLVLCHRSYLWHQLASISIFVRFYGSVKVEGNGTLSQDVLCGRSFDDEKDNQCED